MNIPKFTAESSLYESTRIYRNMRAQGQAQTAINAVVPAFRRPGPIQQSPGGGAVVIADEHCWYISEGGATCQGCCIPLDDEGITYHCWEECTDTTSSTTSGSNLLR